MLQKIKQDIAIGKNIKRLRIQRGIGQTEFSRLLQLQGCDLTREALVKIESCNQHIQASQLVCIKNVLNTSFDELLKSE